jgi:hypothetical protein
MLCINTMKVNHYKYEFFYKQRRKNLTILKVASVDFVDTISRPQREQHHSVQTKLSHLKEHIGGL